MTILRLSKQAIFGDSQLPLTVRDAMTYSPTPRVVAECTKIMFVTSGWSRLTTDEATVNVAAGSVVVIPNGLHCAGAPSGHVGTSTFYVDTGFIARQLEWLPRTHALASLGFGSSHVPQLGITNIGERSMQMLMPMFTALAAIQGRPGSEFATLARVAEVFDVLSHTIGSPTWPSQESAPQLAPRPEVADASTMLRLQLNRNWTVRELANRVSLSESQLSRLFREELGISPAAYLSRARADRMAEILALVSPNVGDAGRQVGWVDLSQASRSFKRRHGTSPQEFVRQSRLYADALEPIRPPHLLEYPKARLSG